MSILKYAPRRAAFLLLSAFLTACALVSPGLDEPTATPQPTATAPSEGPTPTTSSPTPEPAATTSPQGTIAFVGHLSSAVPGSITALSQEGVAAAAAAEGLQIDSVDIGDGDPAESIRAAADRGPVLVVVAGSELADPTWNVAQDYPDINFIGVDQPAVDSLANYFVLGGPGNRLDEEGFMAGMLAGMGTQARILGLVVPAETLEGKLYRNGFIHGYRYTCGQCELFEIAITDPNDSAAGERAANQLIDSSADVIFTATFPGGEATLQQATARGAKVIGLGYYFSAGDNSLVLGNVVRRPDIALPSFIADVLAGIAPEPRSFSLENGSLSYGATNIDPGLANFANDALSMLAAGTLDTGVDLTTGEDK
jgi:basic membrane lipoprotein Med (substrate-binding protein (PBP1-ABC) superfamily)